MTCNIFAGFPITVGLTPTVLQHCTTLGGHVLMTLARNCDQRQSASRNDTTSSSHLAPSSPHLRRSVSTIVGASLSPRTYCASATNVGLSSRPSASESRFLPCKRTASTMLDLGKSDKRTAGNAGPAIDSDDVDIQQTMHMDHRHLQMHLDNRAQLMGEHTSHAIGMRMQEDVQDEEMSTAQRLCGVTIESPSSPGGGYKRMRSSADSDAGSSSCKDMDEPDVLAPDSVPALVAQLRQLLDYVAGKPTLQNGSASFMRDYLRTMLIQNSVAAEEAIQTANKNQKLTGVRKNDECFRRIPDELAKHILSFLDGRNLAKAREVCRRWNEFACDEQLWKALCIKRWRSLETDEPLWKLIDRNVDMSAPNKWRLMYPKICKTPQWKCRLQKTGRFICNLVAHHISGAPLVEPGLPNVLVVERRFNILHLVTFVLPEASVLYFEPEEESDRAGFDDFIEYLHKRTRAGLALEDQKRFIFIPPCDYTRNQVDYQGKSLLGVVQNAYPPLAP